ncbi:hypothetical protein QR680_007485 [Steinernema hermaphroditum]|uniref:Uncharacterized protein n=1 Tax=Steinernema hermaphroditum TaxID=289476 RepID=A0AA39M674_9BILA|nr:hypothetical protein QR680_007485 [Steinernema hermaphroditum]
MRFGTRRCDGGVSSEAVLCCLISAQYLLLSTHIKQHKECVTMAHLLALTNQRNDERISPEEETACKVSMSRPQRATIITATVGEGAPGNKAHHKEDFNLYLTPDDLCLHAEVRKIGRSEVPERWTIIHNKYRYVRAARHAVGAK